MEGYRRAAVPRLGEFCCLKVSRPHPPRPLLLVLTSPPLSSPLQQVHYAIHRPEPHILLYRRPKGYGQNPGPVAAPLPVPVPMVQ